MGRHCGTGSRSSDAGRYAGVCVPAAERTPDEAPPSSTGGAGEEGAGSRENAVRVTNVEADLKGGGPEGPPLRVRDEIRRGAPSGAPIRIAGTAGGSGGTR